MKFSPPCLSHAFLYSAPTYMYAYSFHMEQYCDTAHKSTHFLVPSFNLVRITMIELPINLYIWDLLLQKNRPQMNPTYT